jgi:hypothetical protein
MLQIFEIFQKCAKFLKFFKKKIEIRQIFKILQNSPNFQKISYFLDIWKFFKFFKS